MILKDAIKLDGCLPVGRNIMIKLPDYFKTRERETYSGIYIPHLEGYFEHDVSHGTVIACGEAVELCKVGDEVFFSKICIQNGLQNMGRDKTRPDVNKDTPNTTPVYYLADETGHYLFMPENRMYLIASDMSGDHEADIHGGVICLIRNGELKCVNTWHIIKDAYDKGEETSYTFEGKEVKINAHKTGGLIVAPVLSEEIEKNKRFEIVGSPEDSLLKRGDIVFTAPHCDIPLEGEFNYPVLPKGCYYVRGGDILAKVEAETLEGIIPLP